MRLQLGKHQDNNAVQLFIHLARILSSSGRERQTADLCSQLLTDLGADVYEDETGRLTGGNAGNIIATFKGTAHSVPPLLLNAHLDTVDPGGEIVPRIEHDRIVSSSNTILGADNRAGLVMIILGLKKLLEEKTAKIPTIEVVFTVGEENGLIGASHLDYTRLKSKYGFSCDSSGLGRIVIGAPYYEAIQLTVNGRSAHAGVNPCQGLNSILIMSELVTDLQFGQLDIESTANLGRISGGTARNVIPDLCSADIEVRSHSLNTMNRWIKTLKKRAGQMSKKHYVEFRDRKVAAQVDVKTYREFDGFLLDETSSTVQVATKALKETNRKVIVTQNMGGSDANVFNSNGIQTAIIGTGQTAVHSHDEFITIKDLNDGIDVVKNVIINWTEWWTQKKT